MVTFCRNGKFILFSQYHGYWWAGDANSLGITYNGNGPHLLQYSNPNNKSFLKIFSTSNVCRNTI